MWNPVSSENILETEIKTFSDEGKPREQTF